MEPELELARKFNLSETEARAYIKKIQGWFPQQPSARGIWIFIRGENLAQLPTPETMVRLMTRGKIPVKPPEQESPPSQPPPTSARETSKPARKAFVPKPAADIPLRQRRAGFSKTDLVFESNLDHERLPPEQQECCPHGVLKPGPCAICNPEEFRFLTGID